MPSRCRSGILLITLTTLCLVPVVRGQVKNEAPDPLQPLAWAVGGSWVAERQGSDGKPLTVHVVFRWAEHHKSIHYTISFESQGKRSPQYDGTYYWHPGKKCIALLQIDQRGNVTEARVSTEDKVFKQENVLTGSDGIEHKQRVELIRSGDDAFTMRAFMQRDGQWVEAVSFQYKRVRDNPMG